MKSKLLLLVLVFISIAHLQAQETLSSKKIRFDLGLVSSTTQNVAISFKVGGQKFYGIFDAGKNFDAPDDSFILGLGVGYAFKLNHRSNLALEGRFVGYMFDGFSEEAIDKSFELGVLYEWNINKNLRLSFGPTFSWIENNSGTGFDNKSLFDPLDEEDISGTATGEFIGAKIGFYYRF